MLAPTRIMVPTDFSEYSDRAVAQGLDIARQYNAKLFLLHVVHEDVHRGNFDFTLPEEVVRDMKDGAVSSANSSFQKELDFFPRSKE
ncbi:universal stress protein, partial [archaeon]|nr:universal stress protein [archaeon]